MEAVLAEVAGVGEVAVFGLPDERWGQRVVRRGGARAPGAGGRRRGLAAVVRPTRPPHLAGYKRPKQYVVVDELPRTATGKVRRLALPGLDPA